MQLPPIFDVRKLGRYFSRELPQDKINNANGQIQYVKEHGIIEKHEEPAFAVEVAPRKVKRLSEISSDTENSTSTLVRLSIPGRSQNT